LKISYAGHQFKAEEWHAHAQKVQTLLIDDLDGGEAEAQYDSGPWWIVARFCLGLRPCVQSLRCSDYASVDELVECCNVIRWVVDRHQSEEWLVNIDLRLINS